MQCCVSKSAIAEKVATYRMFVAMCLQYTIHLSRWTFIEWSHNSQKNAGSQFKNWYSEVTWSVINGSPHHWYNTAHYLVSLWILTGGNPDFINITFFKFETFTFFYWWQNIMASIFSSATRVMGEPNITQLMLDACTLHSELYQRMRKGEIGTFCRGCWTYLKRERQLFTFRFIVVCTERVKSFIFACYPIKSYKFYA